MPGLLRGVARSAMAGGGRSVSRRVAQRQEGKWASQGRPAEQQAIPAQGAAPEPVDRLAELKQLGELRDRGVLTEDEFQDQKRRILGQ